MNPLPNSSSDEISFPERTSMAYLYTAERPRPVSPPAYRIRKGPEEIASYIGKQPNFGVTKKSRMIMIL